LILEIFALWMATMFGKWSGDLAFWKVYLASFAFRFVSLGLLFSSLNIGSRHLGESATGEIRKRRSVVRAFPENLLPFVFVMVGGWAWLSSVMYSNPTDTVLRLKVFVVGMLMVFLTG
jgi:hypothetical protein